MFLKLVVLLCALNSPPGVCLKERNFEMIIPKQQEFEYLPGKTVPIIINSWQCFLQAPAIIAKELGPLANVYKVTRIRCTDLEGIEGNA